MKILDIGSGLGSLTVDFASYVPEGQITGVDKNEDVLAKARAYAFPDATFDVTHTHQVLQHVTDPAAVLREMRRVTKPGGFVAARETDSKGAVWYPEIEGMSEFWDMYVRVARARGGEPEAGRRIHVWARQAGFEPSRIVCSSGTWCLSTPDERAFWSNLWAGQLPQPHIGDIALKSGIATKEDIERFVKGWLDWGAAEDAWYSTLAGEFLYQV